MIGIPKEDLTHLQSTLPTYQLQRRSLRVPITQRLSGPLANNLKGGVEESTTLMRQQVQSQKISFDHDSKADSVLGRKGQKSDKDKHICEQ